MVNGESKDKPCLIPMMAWCDLYHSHRTKRFFQMHRLSLKTALIGLMGLGFHSSDALAQSAASVLRWPAKTDSSPFKPTPSEQPSQAGPHFTTDRPGASSNNDDVFTTPQGNDLGLISVPIVTKPALSAVVDLSPAPKQTAYETHAVAPQIINAQPVLAPLGQSYQSVPYKPQTVTQRPPETNNQPSQIITPKAPTPQQEVSLNPEPLSPKSVIPAAPTRSEPKPPVASLTKNTVLPPPPTPNNLQEYRLPAGSKYASRLDKDHILRSPDASAPRATQPLANGQTDDVFVPAKSLHAAIESETQNTSPRVYSLHRQYGYQPDQIPLPDGDNSGLLIPDLSEPNQDSNHNDGLDDITPIIAATRARTEAAARTAKKGS